MISDVILLTGSTGYLGSNILKMLIKCDYKVIILIRSTSSLARIESVKDGCIIYNLDETALNVVFETHKINFVINTAASYGRNNETTSSLINSNVIFPLELLTLSIKYKIDCFINTDSSLNANVNEYSLSKNQFKEWLYFYQHKMCIRNIILEYFYGPHDSDWKFITMALKKFISKTPAFDLTSGEQIRRFIYIDDVVEAFRLLLLYKNYTKQLIEYNLGGTAIKIKDLVYKCKSIAGNTTTKLNFGILSDRNEGVFQEYIDTRLITKIGWAPNIDLNQGLKLTLDSLT